MSDQLPPPGEQPPAGPPGPVDPAATVPPPPPAAAPPPPPPPPPPAAPGPPSHAAAAGGSSGVDIGTAFSWAMSKFGQHAAVLIGLAAIVFVIRLIQSIVSNVIFNNLARQAADNCVNNASLSSCLGVGFGTTIVVNLLLGIIFAILVALVTIGIYRAALKTTLGETPAFEHLTSSENLVPYILVAIVYFVLSFAGLVLCILPGLIVIFLFQFSPFYALDRGNGVGEALGNSYRAVTQNFVPVLLTALINIVIGILSGILFGVLTLVLLPFGALFTAHVYRQLNREPVAA